MIEELPPAGVRVAEAFGDLDDEPVFPGEEAAVVVLSAAGLSPSEIADLLADPATVRRWIAPTTMKA